METLIGPGLRDEKDIGQIQVADTVTEILINGWWLITVEDCMVSKRGEGYWLELLVNHEKTDLVGTGFMTIDDVIDGMFVQDWANVMMMTGININYFKDRSPLTARREANEAAMVTTANASAPNPAKISQQDQDKIDMDVGLNHCACPSTSGRWQRHVGCTFYEAGRRIQTRQKAMLRNFFSGRRS